MEFIWYFLIRLRLHSFGKNTTEMGYVLLCTLSGGYIILICLIASNDNRDDLIKVVSGVFSIVKLLFFSLPSDKYLEEDMLRLYKYPFFPQTFAH